HGFLALEDDTQFLYKTTDYYAKDCERSIVWNDQDLAIDWQIEENMEIQLTEKDRFAPVFKG
ncbi:dTDP-4-dehydrorhamnose 3,5-epimerase, partial [Kaistia algarum]